MAEVNNPFGMLDTYATSLHELYTSFVTSGFTEEQAFRLVSGLSLAALGQKPASGDA